MAQLSLGEARWRMLRRALKKKRLTFEDARNMTRHDRGHFDWLLDQGLFTAVGGGAFEVTGKGRQSADLGLYDWEPAPASAPARPRKGT